MNRHDLRAALHHRLGSTTFEPRWHDEMLDAAIDEAIRRYSTQVPRFAVWSPMVSAGTWEIVVPCHIDPLKIVAVTDEQAFTWEPWTPSLADRIPPPLPYGSPVSGFMWRVWSDTLLLSIPALRTGLWRIDYSAPRQLPINDVSPIDVDPGDEDVIVAQSVAVLLHREAVTEGQVGRRRSARDPRIAAVRSAQMDADRLMGLRVRG